MDQKDTLPLRVSSARLWQMLEQYARYGATPDGGVDRPIFSPADIQVRQRVLADCQALGLTARIDAAANVVCARRGADPALPSMLIGSHLDSVPNGGRYDGPLGVACGLEALRTLEERHIATRHTVQLIAFTGEEATAYGTSTFGSRALAGRLPDVSANRLPDGRTVREGLRDAGGEWEGLPTAREELGPLACFLEVHIEQGTRLEQAEQALGVVSAVCGIHRQRLIFHGQAGHAGTTAMAERRDALRATAHFILAVPALAASIASDDPAATATVGFLEVSPNSPNVIPGRVEVVTDLRSAEKALLDEMARQARAAAEEAAATEGTTLEARIVLDQAPIQFDPHIRATLASVVRELGGEARELASQAGHDAVHLQALAPAGMLFVRCAGGRSHCPDESVTPEDAALAAEALLRAILALDASLDGP